MSDAENFKHWYKERCGHGLAVNIAMKAVIELEKEIAELREFVEMIASGSTETPESAVIHLRIHSREAKKLLNK